MKLFSLWEDYLRVHTVFEMISAVSESSIFFFCLKSTWSTSFFPHFFLWLHPASFYSSAILPFIPFFVLQNPIERSFFFVSLTASFPLTTSLFSHFRHFFFKPYNWLQFWGVFFYHQCLLFLIFPHSAVSWSCQEKPILELVFAHFIIHSLLCFFLF